jgi:hypothetical protein
VTEALVVAAVAAWPPTLAAVLSFLAARSSDRRAVDERAALVAQSLDTLGTTVAHVDAAVERVETGVVELRERVSRLEGASAVRAANG